MRKAIISMVVGASLVAGPLAAVASDTTSPQPSQAATPLTPGGAAGVEQAQNFGNAPMVFWIGAALVITAAILALTHDQDDTIPVTTTATMP